MRTAIAIVSGILATGFFLVGFASGLLGYNMTAITYLSISIAFTVVYLVARDKE